MGSCHVGHDREGLESRLTQLEEINVALRDTVTQRPMIKSKKAHSTKAGYEVDKASPEESRGMKH